MNLEFFNTPEPQVFDSALLPAEQPAFLSYTPDFAAMEAVAQKFSDFENLLLIGNGGSLNTFLGYYYAFRQQATKNVYFLNTVDPDYISELKEKLDPKNTVVVSASKSGENTTQLESCLQFLDYPIVFVTAEGSPIAEMVKVLGSSMLVHPPIGGRYAGLTEVALLPALLCGFNIRDIFSGAQEQYKLFSQDNAAWRAASVLWQLEQRGICDVFVPIYSKYLAPFSNLIMQLCHESFGKNGRGQTYTSLEAPEWQHHSTQRFFGGQHNVAGLFVTVEQFSQEIITKVPESLAQIQVRGKNLGVLNNIPLSKSMGFEIFGNIEDAKSKQIPLVHAILQRVDSLNIGNFTAFWQMYAVYASLLRGVDPFDQPQVEASKTISFQERASL